jgi:hypothetical protein
VVDGEGLAGEERGVAEGDHGHQGADPQAGRLAGQYAEQRPGLEVVVPRRQQVVVDPGAVEAQRLGGAPVPCEVVEGRLGEAQKPNRNWPMVDPPPGR